jgi:cell division transport system permease protein
MNLGRLSVGGAVASWVRNLGTVAPALGSITLLLLLIGAIAVSGVGVRSLLTSQEADASVLHVYLDDSATQDQIGQSRQALSALPHVRKVTYIDKQQALSQARQRPGLGDLASLSDTNPFPASLEVQVDNPTNVAAVAKVAGTEPGVDTRQPTSYDAGTYDRLRQFTVVAGSVAGGFGLLLLVITYVISSNSIRAAVLARRDELLTMQLVGASRLLIRARLGVEGALTGGLAGVLAAGVVIGVCLAGYYGARGLFVQVLPGVTVLAAAEVVIVVAVLGLLLGSVSALFAFRRLRT